jgi:hypothetical protein
MIENRLNVVENLSNVTENWSEMVENWLKMFQIVKNIWKRSKVGENRLKGKNR